MAAAHSSSVPDDGSTVDQWMSAAESVAGAKSVETEAQIISIESLTGFTKLFAGKRHCLSEKIHISPQLWNLLLDDSILTSQQVASCRIEKTDYEQVSCMIRLLEQRHDSLIPKFCEVLIRTGQQHIIDYLFGKLPTANTTSETEDISGCKVWYLSAIEDDLKEYIDPDVVDHLFSISAITHVELQMIQNHTIAFNKNQELLRILHTKGTNEQLKFARSLESTDQYHVVNFIIHEGKKPSFGNDIGNNWPLTKDIISCIDANRPDLVALIDLHGGLIDRLLTSPHCITPLHRKHIESFTSAVERNKQLIDIMRRRSLAHFHTFLSHLTNSGQSELASFLKGCGIIALIKIEIKLPDGGDVSGIESQICSDAGIISRMLSYLSSLVSVISLRRHNSIGVYIALESRAGLHYLQYMCTTNQLQPAFEQVFFESNGTTQKINIAGIVWEPDDYMKCVQYFSNARAAEPQQGTSAADENPTLGLWLPARLLKRILSKSSFLLKRKNKQALQRDNLLKSVCRNWWYIIGNRISNVRGLKVVEHHTLVTSCLPGALVERVLIKAAVSLCLDSPNDSQLEGRAYTMLAGVSSTWWQAMRGKMYVVRMWIRRRIRKTERLPMELLERLLYKGYIGLFRKGFITYEAEEAAYTTLASVSAHWWQTLKGWPQSNTKDWLKHQIRRRIKEHRQQERDEFTAAFEHLIAKREFVRRRTVEKYQLKEVAAKAATIRELQKSQDDVAHDLLHGLKLPGDTVVCTSLSGLALFSYLSDIIFLLLIGGC